MMNKYPLARLGIVLIALGVSLPAQAVPSTFASLRRLLHNPSIPSALLPRRDRS